jgi:hypothetical protein
MAATKKELEKLINCPICFNLASVGPIWTCKNGHHVCYTCKPKLDNCGSCRQPFTTRNLGLERMRDLIPMTCQFGCGIEMKSEDIKSHEETCHNGPLLNCADLSCNLMFRLKNLISHIETCHSAIHNYDQESANSWLIGITQANQKSYMIWEPSRLKSNGDFFFREVKKQKDGTLLAWVYFAGLAQDAAKYTYTIKFHHRYPQKGSVAYTGDVIPMTVDRTTVEEERMGLTFSNYAAKKMICDDVLLFSVNISKQ